jgi:hypothetical protein
MLHRPVVGLVVANASRTCSNHVRDGDLERHFQLPADSRTSFRGLTTSLGLGRAQVFQQSSISKARTIHGFPLNITPLNASMNLNTIT